MWMFTLLNVYVCYSGYINVVEGVSVFLMNRPQTPSGAHKSPWAVKKVSKTINKDKSEAKE